MLKAAILMQLRVMMFIESKKSTVFCTILLYKQSLNELQEPDITGIFGTSNIYALATQP